MSLVRDIPYSSRRTILLALLAVSLMLVAGGCGRNVNRVPIDADGDAIDTVTELETGSTPTAETEEAPAVAQAATDTPAATDTAVPTDTSEPTPTAVPSETPVPTEAPNQAASEATPVVAQAQSPLAAPDAPTSPLPTPVANVSPLQAPTQPASPLVVPSVTSLDQDVEDGVSYVRGRVISTITGNALSRTVVRLPEVVCSPEEDAASEETALPEPGSKGAPSPKESELAKTQEAETQTTDDCFWLLSDALTPATFADENGVFEFAELKPGNYLILLGDMATVYAFALVDVDKPFQFTAPDGGAIDLGDLYIDYQ